MGLWDRFLNMIGLSEKPKESSDTPTQTPRFQSLGDFEALLGEMSSQELHSTIGPGRICSGRVKYVGPSFAKLADGCTVAVVFLGEMSADYIKQASDVLSEGQHVECVPSHICHMMLNQSAGDRHLALLSFNEATALPLLVTVM